MTDAAPRQRVILLGASNLTRAISTVVGITHAVLGPAPRDLLIGFGHGRSYGIPSTVLGRTLPGIVESALWHDLRRLRRDGPSQTHALITDIGNDIMYGVEPEQIVDWIACCLDQLDDAGARTIMTGLPLESIDRLSEFRFRIVKALLFPGRDLTLEMALQRAHRVHALARDLARARGVTFIEQNGAWYGADPVHIRIRDYRAAWSRILGAWIDPNGTRVHDVDAAPGRWLRLRTMTPHRRVLCGWRQRRQQPAGRVEDDATVWMY